jgi:hypothetical protein
MGVECKSDSSGLIIHAFGTRELKRPCETVAKT